MNYENMNRIKYTGGAIFVPVCEKCGRLVKADSTIYTNLDFSFVYLDAPEVVGASSKTWYDD